MTEEQERKYREVQRWMRRDQWLGVAWLGVCALTAYYVFNRGRIDLLTFLLPGTLIAFFFIFMPWFLKRELRKQGLL